MTAPFTQKECAELFKALADETRLKTLHSLFESDKCVSDLMDEFALPQSLISHHLKILKQSGLVDSTRHGHKICYSLHPEVRKNLSESKQETLDLGCCEVRFKE